MASIDPNLVAARLAALAALHVPETVSEGRRRLRAADTPEEFANRVAQRLDELRALDELTRYLHTACPPKV